MRGTKRTVILLFVVQIVSLSIIRGTNSQAGVCRADDHVDACDDCLQNCRRTVFLLLVVQMVSLSIIRGTNGEYLHYLWCKW